MSEETSSKLYAVLVNGLPPVPSLTQNQDWFTAIQDYAIATARPYAEALHNLVRDLEMRATMAGTNVVECGAGVYQKAKEVLGDEQ